jgi:hypothetical protein
LLYTIISPHPCRYGSILNYCPAAEGNNFNLREERKGMMKYMTVFYAFVFFLLFCTGPCLSADKREDEVLNAGETFFVALKEKRFADAWESLTIKSRDTIINEVYNEINKTEAKIGKDLVADDFNKNGELSRLYWNAFLKNFDPDIILEQSIWSIRKIGDDTAIIVLKYKESKYNSELKLYKQDGRWHFGLIESFWIMKRYIK